MNPNYITGLVQADGSFFIAHEKRISSKFGLRLRPKFSLTLHLNSIQTLNQVQQYFHNSGKIYLHEKKQAAELVISSSDQLLNHVIPHFLKYPLYSNKKQAFVRFVFLVKSLKNRDHYLASFDVFVHSLSEKKYLYL